jgi:hypothetical protein
MVNFLKITAIVILFFQVNLVFAQETRIIRIQSGGTVSFNINSFKKYEDGMVLNNWTLVAINFIDAAAPLATWKLEFVALKGTIEGDYLGASDLDLDLITLEVQNEGVNDLSGLIQGSGVYPLSATPTAIILGGGPQGGFEDNKLLISYNLGTGAKKLLNNPANYYYIDIEFILSRVD